MRILIAEDETIIRLDLRELLERAGFEVVAEARDGEEAVELARSAEPDLALLDVKMPRLDGIEAARRILDERAIPIVIVTAYGEEELVLRAVEAGVFGYLVKPFRESDLLPAIATARARHEELVALREEADSLSEALAARNVHLMPGTLFDQPHHFRISLTATMDAIERAIPHLVEVSLSLSRAERHGAGVGGGDHN